MDAVRLGHSFRLRRRWRQVDLGARAGVSATEISRIERGHVGSISVDRLRSVADALEANLDVRLRWNGEGLDRLLDQAHAGLVEEVVRRLQAAGWLAAVEVSFSIRGERGSVDVLGCHQATGMVVVVEVKSVVPDSQATLAGVDRKVRLAPEIARARGWECRGLARLLVVGESTTSRRRIEALGATYRTAFPVGGRDVGRWLRRPVAPIAGLLLAIQPSHARKGGHDRHAAGPSGRTASRGAHTVTRRTSGDNRAAGGR